MIMYPLPICGYYLGIFLGYQDIVFKREEV